MLVDFSIELELHYYRVSLVSVSESGSQKSESLSSKILIIYGEILVNFLRILIIKSIMSQTIKFIQTGATYQNWYRS